MSYIYKITNLITSKVYIGYTSRNIERRFYEHKWAALNHKNDSKKSYLYDSMRKYGTENFIIDIVYQFNEDEEDWSELEKYYITEYDSLVPNGYNLLFGGDMPPIHYGDENLKTKLSDKDLYNLYDKLKDLTLSYKDLSQMFNISESQIMRINKGECRYHEDIEYPIRKYSLQEEYAIQVINILSQDKTLSNKKIANMIPNYFRANEIASINTGKKYAYLWSGDFPIRKELVPDNYEEKQQTALNILEYINNKKIKHEKITQAQIQRDTGYNRSIVEKTLKGIYPYSFSTIEYPVRLNI